MDRFDWLELDQESDAAKRATPAIRTRPTDGPSFYRAAGEMRQSGHFKAAADYYRKTLAFDDHHYDAWTELVDTLVRAGQLDTAEQVSTEAIEAYRRVRPLYAARALVLAHQGRCDEALPMSDVSVEGGDRSWYARCVRGELYLHINRNDRAGALALFEEAMELAQQDWRAPFLAGVGLLDAELPTLAAGFFADAAHLNPHAPVCWLCLGDAFRDLRLYDQAGFYYQRAVELEPTHEVARERQKTTGSLVYGLMRALNRRSMMERWNKLYEKH
ncbi:MAG: tetratricopeptide repeat protein [bacterium]|nr:tetratricopeptide repeat protein [bacterium]